MVKRLKSGSAGRSIALLCAALIGCAASPERPDPSAPTAEQRLQTRDAILGAAGRVEELAEQARQQREEVEALREGLREMRHRLEGKQAKAKRQGLLGAARGALWAIEEAVPVQLLTAMASAAVIVLVIVGVAPARQRPGRRREAE